MQNRYPIWKYLMITLIVTVGVVYALPNLYGEDPSVQISSSTNEPIGEDLLKQAKTALQSRGIVPIKSSISGNMALLRFANTEDQLAALDVIALTLGSDYISALNLAPKTPDWLAAMDAQPMALGLDLRGGVHFLMEVDMDAALSQSMTGYETELKRELRKARISPRSIERQGHGFDVTFRQAAHAEQARELLADNYAELTQITTEQALPENVVRLMLDEREVATIQESALTQNILTLRKRVNELGVAEPIIQRQGRQRIVVELPGVQDTARAKDILGATATLEFRLSDMANDAYTAAQSGRVPAGSKLYQHRDGRPVLLKRTVIVRGENLIGAAAGIDSESGGPMVSVTLDSKGAKRMGETTQENIGRLMAVVFIENKTELTERNGQVVREKRKVEEVISLATIRGAFSKRFQITGLEPQESRTLALLLRSGALAAPMEIIEERTVGPSLGQENIDKGALAVQVGLLVVVIFMMLYYRLFGVIANVALVLNIVLMIAVLSMLQATLTLPGIAGIVLTVGMAVDANVLIFERIKEELGNGSSPQASIYTGYEKALTTIADANVTTLIAAVVLFVFGTGPIKGFAVTLSVGIMTSMFSAILITRALINLIYGGKQLKKLSV